MHESEDFDGLLEAVQRREAVEGCLIELLRAGKASAVNTPTSVRKVFLAFKRGHLL